jgi:hypothetical protein
VTVAANTTAQRKPLALVVHLTKAAATLRTLWRCLVAIAPSVVIPTGAGLALCVLPQAIESLRALAEELGRPGDTVHSVVPLAAYAWMVVVAGTITWYCARITFYVFDSNPTIGNSSPGWPVRLLPRICGLLPPIWSAAAFGILMLHPHDLFERARCTWIMWEFVVLAIAMYAAFALRRPVLKMLGYPIEWSPSRREVTGRPALSALPIASLIPLALVGAGWVLFGVWIGWTLGDHLTWFTAPGVLMLSVAAWVTGGSWLLYESRRHEFPFVRLVVLLLILWTGFNLNDNHRVREVKSGSMVRSPIPAGIAFREWLARRPDRARYRKAYPVFIVAAEGGGIRAAHVAALTMSYLTDRCPAFPVHTFAISAVSGGSVGSAAYVLATKRRSYRDAGLGCRAQGDTSLPEQGSVTGMVARFLDHDFLTPPLADGLSADLLARLLPVRWPQIDRARALELAFSHAWQDAIDETHDSAGEFERSFLGNSSDTSAGWSPAAHVPALVLNTTRVETGERVLVSQLEPQEPDFVGAVSMADVDSTLDVPLSTAVGFSARFPVITPAAVVNPRVQVDSEPATLRFVDGGYFDDSGLATALTLATLVENMGGDSVVPVVIRLGFDDQKRGRKAARWGSQSRYEPWAEMLSPVRALLNARDAHVASAVAGLRRIQRIRLAADSAVRALCPSCAVTVSQNRIQSEELLLRQDSVTYVLGWQMSHGAHEAAVSALAPPPDCRTAIAAPQKRLAEGRHGRLRGLFPVEGNDMAYCRLVALLTAQGR